MTRLELLIINTTILGLQIDAALLKCLRSLKTFVLLIILYHLPCSA